MKSCFSLKGFGLLMLSLLLSGVVAGGGVAAGTPDSAPGGGELLARARKEGALVMYAAIDKVTGEKLVQDFNILYPGIKVYLVDQSGIEVFNNYMFDQGKRREAADLLWSSEVELQAALVKDGYASPYRSTETGAIFSWANLGDLAYATGYEPVAMVYNRKFLAEKDVPASHKVLLKVAAAERFKGKIATCDPEKNGQAFSFLTHDQTSGLQFWSLVKAFGAAGVQLYPDYAALLDRVASGEALLGYNVPAREAFRRAGLDPAVGVLYPGDFTLATPQTILITKGAPHPNAARLWVDYILSARGQELLSRETNLLPVRGGVAGGELARQPHKLPAGRGLKVMMPTGDITRYNEQGIRKGFLLRWRQMLGRAK